MLKKNINRVRNKKMADRIKYLFGGSSGFVATVQTSRSMINNSLQASYDQEVKKKLYT